MFRFSRKSLIFCSLALNSVKAQLQPTIKESGGKNGVERLFTSFLEENIHLTFWSKCEIVLKEVKQIWVEKTHLKFSSIDCRKKNGTQKRIGTLVESRQYIKTSQSYSA